ARETMSHLATSKRPKAPRYDAAMCDSAWRLRVGSLLRVENCFLVESPLLAKDFRPLFTLAQKNSPRSVTGGYLVYATLSPKPEAFAQVPNSGRRRPSCPCRRETMALCIWLTRLSERSSVAPISFIVISS